MLKRPSGSDQVSDHRETSFDAKKGKLKVQKLSLQLIVVYQLVSCLRRRMVSTNEVTI